MKPITLLTTLLLLTFAAQAQQPAQQPDATNQIKSTDAVPPQAKAKGKKDFITLERGACFGTCPIYKVTVASDGLVTFEGMNYTKTKGKATARIKPSAFKQLVKEFEQLKYFSLDDKYEPGTPGCGPSATDLPYLRSSIQIKGKLKSISHYQGCLSSQIVHSLMALDRRIDQVAGTAKWIK
jgi:hypothetical protein